MVIRLLSDKEEIYNFLKKSPGLYLYMIGDLDAFFWHYTTWYALYEGEKITAIAMIYFGMETPTLICLYDGEPDRSRALLKGIRQLLPGQFYAHLGKELKEIFRGTHSITDIGHDYRMILKRDPDFIYDPGIRQLTEKDLPLIKQLYEIAYPENWFDSRMLETGKYFGYFLSDTLAGIAGIHVYSPDYQAAALGNIATHPEFRGQRIAYKLTSALCSNLLKSVKTIGLNVKSDNTAAIRCYENAGFEITASFDESLIRIG